MPTVERKQKPHGDHLAGLHLGLRNCPNSAQPIIDSTENVDATIFGSHDARLSYPLDTDRLARFCDYFNLHHWLLTDGWPQSTSIPIHY